MSVDIDTGDGLNETSKRVLATIHLLGGEANTSEISNHCGESSSNVGNHCRDYLSGLVEKVGVDRSGPGPDSNPPNLWALTDEGERVAEALDAPLTQSELQALARANADRLDAVRSDLEQVEREQARVKEKINEEIIPALERALRLAGNQNSEGEGSGGVGDE